MFIYVFVVWHFNQTARIMTFKSTWEQILLYGNFWLLMTSRAKISLPACITWPVNKMNTNTKLINKVKDNINSVFFSLLPGGICKSSLRHWQIIGMSLWNLQKFKLLKCNISFSILQMFWGLCLSFELPWNPDDKYCGLFIFPSLGAALACLQTVKNYCQETTVTDIWLLFSIPSLCK